MPQRTLDLDNSAPLMDRCESAQVERALSLLELARTQPVRRTQFALEVGALHLARSIPEYWYTTADLVAQASNAKPVDAKKLSVQLEEIFAKARHYQMLTALRRWDFHWEPLHDPVGFTPAHTYRRGAPMRLTTGPTPNSVAGVVGFEPMFAGSGRRVGRANYYHIEQSGFADEESGEVVPLGLALERFLEDLPGCRVEAMAIPEISAYFALPQHRPFPASVNFRPLEGAD